MNIEKYYHKITKVSFIRNVFLISGGTVIAQILTILFKPIISRLYTPEEYGVLSIFIALLSILGALGTLKFELGIPIAKNDVEAYSLVYISMISLITYTLFIIIILMSGGEWFLRVFGAEDVFNYRYFIPIGVFLLCYYSIFSQWAFREKNFRNLAKTKVTQSIMKNITMLITGGLSLGSPGLLIGQIIGQSGGVISLSTPFFRRFSSIKKRITIIDLTHALKKYKKFPMFTAPSQILSLLGLNLPILVIASSYGSQMAGLYGMANGIVQIPMVLIGKSVSDVFYAEAAENAQNNPKKLLRMSNSVTKTLSLYGFVPLVIFLLFAPVLFSFVFGDKWYSAGEFAQIISLLVYTKFIFSPTNTLYTVLQEQQIELVVNLLRLVFVAIAFTLSYVLNTSVYMSVIFYAVAMSISYFSSYLIVIRILKNKIQNQKK